MNNIYKFQEEAIQKIIEYYKSNIQNAKISISTGLGLKTILINVIEKILKLDNNSKILLLCGTENQVTQYYEDLTTHCKSLNVINYLPNLKENGIFIDTYQNILQKTIELDFNNFNLIICNDIDFIYDQYIYPFFSQEYKGKRLSISHTNRKNKLIEKDKLIFKYNISDAIEDGYYASKNEKEFVTQFFPNLITQLGFENIEEKLKGKEYYIDMISSYNNKKYIFEFKTYRTERASSSLIEKSAYTFLEMVKELKKDEYNFIMVVTCKVETELKKEILNKTNIEIWDISNLLYLCSNSQPLMQELSLYIPFPIIDIKREKTILFNKESETINKANIESHYDKYENLLKECKSGKEDEKKYEEICTEIINYLFETEFFQKSTQHKTGDNLFRMDMICSLKGTTEFWRFLMQFLNTKFIVFEYKNYTEKISQNIIFITSKYLHPMALRNVAFIISRHGLDTNANTIVTSKIKDEKKLIISLTDEDLLIMVALKDSGKEPSDYLLEKVENLLMSISI